MVTTRFLAPWSQCLRKYGKTLKVSFLEGGGEGMEGKKTAGNREQRRALQGNAHSNTFVDLIH